MNRMPLRGALPWLAVLLTVGAVLAAGRTGSNLVRPGVDPEDVIHANNRGAALMERFSHAQALEEYKKVTALAPRWAPGFVNLGLAALYTRDAEQSEQAFREAMRLDARLIQGAYGLALVLKNGGRTEEAIAAMEKARALDPADPDILYNLGLLEARRRHFDDAVARLRQARTIDPNSMAIRYQLARALLQAGQREAGEKEMTAYQSLAANPKFSVPTGNQYGEAGRYGLVVVDYTAFGGPPPPPPPSALRFTVLPSNAGVTFVHGGPGGEAGGKGAGAGPAAAARYGSGVAVGDFDGDGRPDLVFANASADGRARPALYRNEGGWSFRDVTGRSKVAFQGVGTGVSLADFDNDGDQDLVLSRLGGLALFDNQGDGTFREITAAAGISVIGFSLGVTWADVDHDGDLDLLVSRLPEPGGAAAAAAMLWLNKGDRTFRDATGDLHLQGPPGGSFGAVFSDLDLDRDIDAVYAVPGGQVPLMDNRRDQGFAGTGGEAGLPSVNGGRGVSAGDVNGDGLSDLVLAGDGARLWLNGRGLRFTPRDLPVPAGLALYGSLLLDADNDGDLDLVLAGSRLLFLRNDGEGVFSDASEAAGLGAVGLKDGRAVAAADLDADGDLDLVVTRNGGAPILLRNDGGSGNRWLVVEPRGLNSNHDGIGTRVEVQSGAFWQRREVQGSSGYLAQSPPVAHFGLRDRALADVVRLLWPGGVLQAELDVSAGQVVEQGELDRKGSSCPLLFAWNGARYGFVTDFLGVGGLGLWLGPNLRGTPDPDEYVKIEPDQLAPLDGAYLLQVMENLEEITYLDETTLMVVDHPRGIDVYPNEQFGVKDPAPHRLFAIERESRIFPVRATSSKGRDVLERLTSIDRRYPDDFRLSRLAGFAEMHHLDLEFPDGVEGRTDLVLFLYGWVDFEYSSSNYAAHQSGILLTQPILEVEGEDGLYRPLLDPMGFPPGMPRMMTVDLSRSGPLPTRRIRLRTNMRVFWDQIFLAPPLPDDRMEELVKVQEVAPSGAHLHRRGYPREHSPDGLEPKLYDYAIMDNTQPFKVMTGDYTRFGRVTDLLRHSDDKFVIFGRGEEVTLEFPVKGLPRLPNNWQRSFVLHAAGYCKDMDPHTAHPDTVEPLPFRGMSGYPYGGDEAYPDDADHREYRRTYNTRRLEGR